MRVRHCGGPCDIGTAEPAGRKGRASLFPLLAAAAPSSGDPALRTPHRVPKVDTRDGPISSSGARTKGLEAPLRSRLFRIRIQIPIQARIPYVLGLESMSVGPLLANKIVCITGSSRGIGRACALECAKHGATGLVLHYFGDEATEQEVLSLKEEIETQFLPAKAVIVPGDIGDPVTSTKVKAYHVAATYHTNLEIVDCRCCCDYFPQNR